MDFYFLTFSLVGITIGHFNSCYICDNMYSEGNASSTSSSTLNFRNLKEFSDNPHYQKNYLGIIFTSYMNY